MKQSVYIIQSAPSWLKTAPLSLAYLSTYLTNNGFLVKTADLNLELFKRFGLAQNDWLKLNAEFEENIFKQTLLKAPLVLDKFFNDIRDYDAVGFSILKRNFNFSINLAQKILDRFPYKKIIFGGPHTLYLDRLSSLDERFHWVIGEGEIPISSMLTSSKEKIIRFKELKNLEETGLLDFGTLNPLDYSESIPIISSRGCPFNCKFCSENKLYKNFRNYSVNFMIEQIKYLTNKHKSKNFVLCDSLINYDNNWLYEFSKLIIKENLAIKWQAQMRVDKNFSVELGNIMKESGCYNLFTGLESASDNVLRNMNKGFTSNTALDFFKKLSKSGLQFEISLIFGYPGETNNDFNETVDFIVKNKRIIPKIAQANLFVDYFDNFRENHLSAGESGERIVKFLSILKQEKIRYTKSFIGNLAYK